MGLNEGAFDGVRKGAMVGGAVGPDEGRPLGAIEGFSVKGAGMGEVEGLRIGTSVGLLVVSAKVGDLEGLIVFWDGSMVGDCNGVRVGDSDGNVVGWAAEGAPVGALEGTSVDNSVGDDVLSSTMTRSGTMPRFA